MAATRILSLTQKIASQLIDNQVEDLSSIELDLLMQRMRDLYEELETIKLAGRTGKTSDTGHKTEAPNVILTVNQSPEIEPEAEEVVLPDPITLHQAKHPIRDLMTAVKAEPERKKASASLNESVKHGASLNEKLKSSSTEVHHKFIHRPLKDMIDLNKKYVMVNELFAGNLNAYNKAITDLDELDNLPAALTYVQCELAGMRSWDESTQPVRMFMKLVSQRFGAE
jgi:hypothetical protein